MNQLQHQYHYDEQNQLTRETILSSTGNVVVHEFTYTYDTFGNIRSRVHWQGNTTRTTTLQYGNTQWRDLLTQINLNGAITNVNYDGNTGNPLNWHTGATLTWARGRQLQRLQRTGVDVTFTYDHAGIRTGKRVNRNGAITEHSFYTQNGTIVGETRRNPNGTVDRLEFIYDEAGRPLQLLFNGRIYNYVLNLQGDIQQIRRSTDGVVVATYLYNAWGQLLQSSGAMAESNPIRYRGYFWCSAAEMYYLQSRFYDPVVGRFINADATWVLGVEQGTLLQYNLFAYCHNNPVNFDDPSGYIPITLALGGLLLAGALLVAVSYAAIDALQSGPEIASISAPNIAITPPRQISVPVTLTIITWTSVANAIDRSLAQAQPRNYRSEGEWHHIVCQGHPRAAAARTILRRVNISINDGRNMVFVRTAAHRRFHNHMYIDWVTQVLTTAFHRANGNPVLQQQNVSAALRGIKNLLQARYGI